MSTHKAEIESGRRFGFGRNWQSFAQNLTPERVAIAEGSLKDLLQVEDLKGKSFLDAGSGSGLFSLAARNLGAHVHSFDFDPDSVACTAARRSNDDSEWTVEEGSVLDQEYLASLGQFDIVYSWGVLHHTGDMWAAISNVTELVKADGRLSIAIYNDQGKVSVLWRRIKEIYCSGLPGKALVLLVFLPYFWLRTIVKSIRQRKNAFADYRERRGMSITHDWHDWLGGLPFEVASVHNITRFLRENGFELLNVRTTEGRGNNQFLFGRVAD
jgi:2-polyprenyl-6-hydroxyphenyl methylase/3-demethylubiquinone-9 3-methyltransferase